MSRYNDRRPSWEGDRHDEADVYHGDVAPIVGSDALSQSSAAPASMGSAYNLPGIQPPGESTAGTTDTSLFSKKFRDHLRGRMASHKEDLWKLSVLKATTREIRAPKSKHVMVLLNGLNYSGEDVSNRDSATGAILYHFQKRLGERDWIVAMKALSCLHYLMRETSNQAFIRVVGNPQRPLVDTTRFEDVNPEGFAYVASVQSYGAYLTAWCAMKLESSFPPTKQLGVASSAQQHNDESKFHELFRKSSPPQLLEHTPRLLAAFEKLLAVRFNAPEVSAAAVQLCAEDFNILWSSLNECVDGLASCFFRLRQSDAKRARELFRKFVVDLAPGVREMGAVFASSTSFKTPEIPAPPTQLLRDMEDYIRSGGGGGFGGGGGGGAGAGGFERSEFDRYADEPSPRGGRRGRGLRYADEYYDDDSDRWYNDRRDGGGRRRSRAPAMSGFADEQDMREAALAPANALFDPFGAQAAAPQPPAAAAIAAPPGGGDGDDDALDNDRDDRHRRRGSPGRRRRHARRGGSEDSGSGYGGSFAGADDFNPFGGREGTVAADGWNSGGAVAGGAGALALVPAGAAAYASSQGNGYAAGGAMGQQMYATAHPAMMAQQQQQQLARRQQLMMQQRQQQMMMMQQQQQQQQQRQMLLYQQQMMNSVRGPQGRY